MGHKQLKWKMYTSFELCMVKVFLTNKKACILVCIYRLLFVSVILFLQEITELLETIITKHDCIIIAGDVNIHTETNETYARQFREILDMFNVTQHVRVPTHKMGHTLDIVATFTFNPTVTNIEAKEYDISHHFFVDFTVTCSPVIKEYKMIHYRNIKAIDDEEFTNTVNTLLNGLPREGTFGQKVKRYNEVLAEVLQKHAPLMSMKQKIVPNAPWFDNEYRNLRKLRRKAEKQFVKSGLLRDKESFINMRKQATDLAYSKKREYYEKKLNKAPRHCIQ